MRRHLVRAAILSGLLFAAAPAEAVSSLTSYDAVHDALVAVWSELPLSVRNATLTEAPAKAFGDYVERKSHSYGPGEAIAVYVEVLGYGWKNNGDGTWSILLDADLNLLNAAGTTVAAQKSFLSSDRRSREKSLETDLTFTAKLSSFPPGDYGLQYVLHDRAANKDVTFTLPVTLTGPAAAKTP
jgi:hypothetical protein